jgi:hypothetical protein
VSATRPMSDQLQKHFAVLEDVRERNDRYRLTGRLARRVVNASQGAHDRAALVEVCDALVAELARVRSGR